MHGKLKDLKKFNTPAPNKYEVNKSGKNRIYFILQAIVAEDKPSFAFGIKHSPYMYSGKTVNGDRWISAKTETVVDSEEFRPRSGTFTRDKESLKYQIIFWSL